MREAGRRRSSPVDFHSHSHHLKLMKAKEEEEEPLVSGSISGNLISPAIFFSFFLGVVKRRREPKIVKQR